ncbi:MAG TPA: N-methyl-L-tryptophan oxidase [Anaerolineae bacterium]|nr:N-methyl-L-tryptophan oxidase [Anaerolineae bacterium]
MRRDYPYIVIGLGGIGSGAIYWLARRAGAEVLGLEQFAIGHVRGASQDHSRIIRLSYHTPTYVELAQQAYAAWDALEHDANEKLILKTGGLDFAPRVSRIPLSDYLDSLTAASVPFEHLDADEIMRRWPQFRLTDDIHGLYQSESGIAPAIKCNAAHLRLAREYGATLRENTPVTAIRDRGGEIEVDAGDTTYRCKKLIMAVDAWSNPLLAHFGLKLPLTITQEQVTYFASPHREDFLPDRFPIWIWMDDPCYYGFPVYGEPGPKAAQDVGGDEVTPEARSFEPNPITLQRVKDFLGKYIPTALGPILYTKTCLYTLPPDRDFVLDALPGHSDCFIALGAAHGFKFASLLGKILSELALDGSTASNIEPFKIDRPILRLENPPKSFMV